MMLTFYSLFQKKIVTSYCDSLFVGHFSAEDLIKHVYEFINRYDLNVGILLNIGMDGPNVNKNFKRKLLESLKKSKSTTFICILTCSLHIANNAFGWKNDNIEGSCEPWPICNLSPVFLSDNSARLDLKLVSEIRDVTVHYVLCHCQTWWLSIEKALLPIAEQIDNLPEYFLIELPKQKSFKGKIGLDDKSLLPYMVFVVFISQDVCRLLIPLETKAPMIHSLYLMQRKLIQSLLTNFTKTGVFMKKDGTHLLPNKKLEQLDIYEMGNQLVSIFNM